MNTFIIHLCPDQDPDDLLNTRQFGDIVVKFTMPDSLNLVKGIIHHDELAYMEEDEVLEMTEDLGVVKVSKPRHGTYAILAWKRSAGAIPSTLLVAYDRVKVKPCLPRPRRCYCCHTYGHTAAECTKDPVCSRCGQEHDQQQCNNNPHCVACGGDHAATDPDCPKWKEEKEVMKIRNEKKISYSEAVKQKKRQDQETRQEETRQEDPRQKEEGQEEDREEAEGNQEQQEEDDTEEEIDVETQQEEDKKDKQPEENRGKKHSGGWQQASSRKKKR